MKKVFNYLIVAILLLASSTISINTVAQAEETVNAKAVYCIDYYTGTVINEKNSTEHFQIASMVKIMTLILAYEGIDDMDLSFNEKITISDNASSMGGSQMFLESGDQYTISDLIKGIVIISANDASVQIAEIISGSEEDFVRKMNEKATELNMKNTLFANCTGLPANNQYSSAQDVAIMYKELLTHKEYFEFSKIWIEDFNHPDGRVTQFVNTNKLIRFYKDCDGGKTGYTSAALFCLAATASRNDMRLITVVIGAPASKSRFATASSLFNYGFSAYENRCIINSEETLPRKMQIEGGKEYELNMKASISYYIFIKKGDKKDYNVEYVLPQSQKAPIKIGDVVGYVEINESGVLTSIPILAAEDIDVLSYNDSVNRVIGEW